MGKLLEELILQRFQSLLVGESSISENLNECSTPINESPKDPYKRAVVDAELDLQSFSTHPPLQTAPEESQVPTVAAGPGSSGSGTNVVPRKIAMVEDTNQQATAGTSSDRKRFTGSQKRKG